MQYTRAIKTTTLKTAASTITALAAIGLAAHPAHAQLTGFVNSPTSDSADFGQFVTAHGGTMNSSVNFDGMATGTLNSTFYATSDGVTLTGSNGYNTVASGAGPGQGNTFTGPVFSGEGTHAVSNYLVANGNGQFVITFAQKVSGAGLSTIDLFDPSGAVSPTLSAYSGAGGTGTLLGTFSAAHYNLQCNNLYFMGFATTDGTSQIGSVVLSRAGDGTGDTFGVDDVKFSQSATPTPEPSSVAAFGFVGLGAAGMILKARKRSRIA